MGRAVLLVLVTTTPALAEDAPSLVGLRSVSDVVTASAHERIGEAELERHVEARLEKAGLIAEPGSEASGRITVDVTVIRSRARAGQCAYTAYDVRVSLAEPALLERAPETSIFAVTWRGAGRVSSFAGAIQPESIMEIVDNQLNSLIAAVGAARHGP